MTDTASVDGKLSWSPQIDHSVHALYKELARCLKRDIVNGKLKPGTRLPPQRDLADYLGINVSTVSKAFKLCELKGLLTATVGNGTFIAYSALTDKKFTSTHHEEGMIDMSSAVPDTSANTILLSLMQEMLQAENAAELFNFNGSAVCEWQQDAAAALMKMCGHSANRGNILFANGAQNALVACFAALFSHGHSIAVENHTYQGAKFAATLFGIKLVPIKSTEDGMDPYDLEKKCQSSRIHGIYLVSACHNPTTSTMPGDKREYIAAIARKYDCILIEDGTFHLMYPHLKATADFAPERSLYITTLSKVIAPGLRAACISAPESQIGFLSTALATMNIGVTPAIAELAARVVFSDRLKEIITAHKRAISARSAIVSQYLPGENYRGNEYDIYKWVFLPPEIQPMEFEKRAHDIGIKVTAAERFAVGNTPPVRAFRMTTCATENTEKFETGLKKLLRIISGEY